MGLNGWLNVRTRLFFKYMDKAYIYTDFQLNCPQTNLFNTT
jgi:hypothetical protein